MGPAPVHATALPPGPAADRVAGVLLGLAESLAERGAFDPGDVFGRYLAWHREGAFDTGPVLALAAGWVTPAPETADSYARDHGGGAPRC